MLTLSTASKQIIPTHTQRRCPAPYCWNLVLIMVSCGRTSRPSTFLRSGACGRSGNGCVIGAARSSGNGWVIRVAEGSGKGCVMVRFNLRSNRRNLRPMIAVLITTTVSTVSQNGLKKRAQPGIRGTSSDAFGASSSAARFGVPFCPSTPRCFCGSVCHGKRPATVCGTWLKSNNVHAR